MKVRPAPVLRRRRAHLHALRSHARRLPRRAGEVPDRRNGTALSEPEEFARPFGRRHGERGPAARLTCLALRHPPVHKSCGLKRSRGSGVATFRAVRIDKSESGQTAKLVDFDESELMDGDVTVRVEWSTVNYKDGLAVSGKEIGRAHV